VRTISCWRLRSALTAYVDDEISPQERRRVDMHLGRCESCRQRVVRHAAVRQRVRRWSTESRFAGVPLTYPAGADRPAPARGAALWIPGAAGLMAALLVLAIWSRGGGDAAEAFVARGRITDSRCATAHAHSAATFRTMNETDCVRRCVELGAQYVFLSDGVIYLIRNQGLDDLAHLAGRDVHLEGVVENEVVTVSRVQPS
jgi:hypothetical protein